MKRAILMALVLLARPAYAAIELNIEHDPLPLVELTVIVPSGFETSTPEESGAALAMGEILDAGTKTLDRQAFLDRLASFGASADFKSNNLYSVWSLTFPIVEGKDYGALASLLAENWNSPRLTDESFRIAKRKLAATLEHGLDSDMSLGISTARRWINRKHFGDYPLTMDGLASLRLDTVRRVWNRDFVAASDIWAGVVAPEASVPMVRELLSRVFAAQGGIALSKAPKSLHLRKPSVGGEKSGPVFLILDKPGRTQTMTSVLAVSRSHYSSTEELAAEFGRHVLVDNGLGSIFGEEIRTKRGLAYAVSGVAPWYLGHPTLGVAANPVRPKTDEALGVLSNLVDTGFEKPSLIDDLPDEAWNRQWQSFVYGKLLERSTPAGRIGERMDVVTGELSTELYAKDIDKWKTNRGEVSKTLAHTWADSIIVGAVVGDAKELEPMIKAHFPQYRTVVIPYRESVVSKTYE